MMTNLTATAAKAVYSNWSKVGIRRGWVQGAGPARYGWYYQHPLRREYLGKTKADVFLAAAQVLAWEDRYYSDRLTEEDRAEVRKGKEHLDKLIASGKAVY